MAAFLYRLGHFSVRRRRLVLLAWLALFAATGIAAKAAGGEVKDVFTLPGTESQEALALLEERFPSQGGSSTQVVFVAPDGAKIDEPTVAAAIDKVMARAAKIGGVSAALPPAATGTVSPDKTLGLGMVRYPISGFEVADETTDEVAEVVASVGKAGIQVEFGGEVVPGMSHEPPSSELLGLAVAALVLLGAFGSVLAMGLPIFTALVGLGIGVSGIGLMSAFVDLASSAPTLAMMIGLAVGIDYALFVVTRHRQNLGSRLDVEEAAARANATAGTAVVFAGMVVVIALSSLAVVGIPFLTVMGLAAAVTVAIAVLVAVTLLPAMLGFVGRNIDKLRVPGLRNRTGGIHEGESFGTRWARGVTRRPVTALLVALIAMGVLAAPAASMHLGLPDSGSEPTSTTQRRAYDLISDAFGAGFNGQLSVVVDAAATEKAVAKSAEQIGAALAQVEGVAGVQPAIFNEARDAAVISVVPTHGPASVETEDLVAELRGELRPSLEQKASARYYVAGTTAANIDVSHKIGGALVPFMLLVIGLTVILLMVVYRSILVPIKAAFAILISIGASFGVVVAIFNWGWLAGLVGLDQTMPIISFLPVMMFGILFGLSMDYEVFILSRIHEEYHAHGDAKRSVVVGLSSSARVITAAALIMISVFGAFALGENPIIKMFGIGQATAVLLDATVVRMVIVPSVMTLFGERAWKLPPWLDRILPNLDVEGRSLALLLAESDAAAAAKAGSANGNGSSSAKGSSAESELASADRGTFN